MILPSESGDFNLTEDMIAGFQLQNPAIQVRDECLKASLWLYRHPAFRPVYPLRFLANWLKKCKPKTVQLRSVGGNISESELLAAGAKLGIAPRPGEGWPQFGRRVTETSEKLRREA